MSDYPELAEAIADVERVYADQLKRREEAVASGEIDSDHAEQNPLYAYRYENTEDGTVEIRKDSDAPARVIPPAS